MIAPADNLAKAGGRFVLQPNSTSDNIFFLTSNRRELRAIAVLLRKSCSREELDRTAGCSNGPDLIMRLRRRGLEIPCKRIRCVDRDGARTYYGLYYLTDNDRALIRAARGRSE